MSVEQSLPTASIRIGIVAICLLGASAFAQSTACKSGEYLTVDGRCLHDRTGEKMSAGDGCNTVICMDPSCRVMSGTAMDCSHPGPTRSAQQYPWVFDGSKFVCARSHLVRRHWWQKKHEACNSQNVLTAVFGR